MTTTIFVTKQETPIGEVVAWRTQQGLVALGFTDQWERLSQWLRVRFSKAVESPDPSNNVRDAITQYFTGNVDAFDALPIDPRGTELQQKIWQLLRRVPAGETHAYAQLAKRAGTSPRVVGNAMAANPVCLALPCHRVIRSDGTWQGYAYGDHRKRWLLDHEAQHAEPQHPEPLR